MRRSLCSVLLLVSALWPLAGASAITGEMPSTGFEAPQFTIGNINNQQLWFCSPLCPTSPPGGIVNSGNGSAQSAFLTKNTSQPHNTQIGFQSPPFWDSTPAEIDVDVFLDDNGGSSYFFSVQQQSPNQITAQIEFNSNGYIYVWDLGSRIQPPSQPFWNPSWNTYVLRLDYQSATYEFLTGPDRNHLTSIGNFRFGGAAISVDLCVFWSDNNQDLGAGSFSGDPNTGTYIDNFVVLPTCPNCGGTFVKTYLVTGPGNGTPWSWLLHSVNGDFVDTPIGNDPGISGTTLQVAQKLATDINNVAIAHGCGNNPGSGSYQLYAAAALTSGSVYLTVAAACDFELHIGPPNNPNCSVVYPFAACPFNPTIQQISLPGLDCNRNGWDDAYDLSSGYSHDLNANGIPDECECPAQVNGDLSIDSVVNGRDVQPFVAALLAHSTRAADLCRGDFNASGMIDVGDIQPFVQKLLHP